MDNDRIYNHNNSGLNLSGLGVAMVTPFNMDKSIDFETFANLIDYLIEGGVDYLVILGTTAETPTLSNSERKEIQKFAVNHVNGRVPLVLGLGGNCTAHVIDEIKSTDLTGFSAILSVAPYYNKPNQEGIYKHFSEIAKACPIPVVLYNVPGRTGVNIEADTTLRLASEFRNIIAIKEASGNILQIEEILNKKPSHFQVISGDDSLTYELVKKGASGVISVIGNAFPSEFGKMLKLCKMGKTEEAEKINTNFSKLYDVLFIDGNPAGVKCVLSEMNKIKNVLRLPLTPVSKATEQSIKEILKNF